MSPSLRHAMLFAALSCFPAWTAGAPPGLFPIARPPVWSASMQVDAKVVLKTCQHWMADGRSAWMIMPASACSVLYTQIDGDILQHLCQAELMHHRHPACLTGEPLTGPHRLPACTSASVAPSALAGGSASRLHACQRDASMEPSTCPLWNPLEAKPVARKT